MLTLGWPQLVLIVLTCIDLGLRWEMHGKEQKAKPYSAWPGLISTVWVFWVLYMGGFFTGGVR